MILSIVAIALGAALGALLHWYLDNRLNASFPPLPSLTFAAKMLGEYLIGIAMAVFLAYPSLAHEWRLLTVAGVLGSLTTYSIFFAEVVAALGISGVTTFAGVEGVVSDGRRHSALFFELVDQPIENMMAVTEAQAVALLDRINTTDTRLFFIKIPIEELGLQATESSEIKRLGLSYV